MLKTFNDDFQLLSLYSIAFLRQGLQIPSSSALEFEVVPVKLLQTDRSRRDSLGLPQQMTRVANLTQRSLYIVV